MLSGFSNTGTPLHETGLYSRDPEIEVSQNFVDPFVSATFISMPVRLHRLAISIITFPDCRFANRRNTDSIACIQVEKLCLFLLDYVLIGNTHT